MTTSPEVRALRDLVQGFLADYLRLVDPDMVRLLRMEALVVHRRHRDGVTVTGEVVTRKRGDKAVIVVRIEEEWREPEEMVEAVARTLEGLGVGYGTPVIVSILALRGGQPGIRLETVPVARVGGVEVLRLYYQAFGLSEARAEPFLERPEPVAWAFSAAMRPRARSLEEHRRACLARLSGASLAPAVRRRLRRAAEVLMQE